VALLLVQEVVGFAGIEVKAASGEDQIQEKGIIPVWNDSFFPAPFFRLIGSEPRPSLTFVRG
jgi:hypothetical protein